MPRRAAALPLPGGSVTRPRTGSPGPVLIRRPHAVPRRARRTGPRGRWFLRGVLHRALGVGAATWGGPLVPARARLGNFPPSGLLHLVAAAATRTRVTATRPPALVVGDRMLEIAVAGMPRTRRERTFPVPDLHQVPEGVAGLVGMRFVPMVAVGHWNGAELDGELPAVGEGEVPGAVSIWRAGIVLAGERPRAVPAIGWRGFGSLRPHRLAASVADRVAVGVGDGDAPLAMRAAGRHGG